MIEKLHNMANTILGLDTLNYTDNQFRFIVINPNGYILKLYNEGDYIVTPIKIKRNNTTEYLLTEGTYYLRCYEKDEQGNLVKKYFLDILVSKDMLGRSMSVGV